MRELLAFMGIVFEILFAMLVVAGMLNSLNLLSGTLFFVVHILSLDQIIKMARVIERKKLLGEDDV